MILQFQPTNQPTNTHTYTFYLSFLQGLYRADPSSAFVVAFCLLLLLLLLLHRHHPLCRFMYVPKMNVRTKKTLSMEVTKEDVYDGKILKKLVGNVASENNDVKKAPAHVWCLRL